VAESALLPVASTLALRQARSPCEVQVLPPFQFFGHTGSKMADIATTLTVLGQGLNVLKDLNNVDREWDKAELKLRVAELAGALSRANVSLTEAQTELKQKDDEIASLRAAFREKKGLLEHHGYHYRKRSDNGQPQGRPYCSRCLQDGRLFMTTVSIKSGRPVTCPQCKADYHGVSGFAFEA
jgi:hypothetical protein